MTSAENRLVETVTLGQAKAMVKALAGEQSLLLLSPPGVGKSDAVAQAAAEAGLPCRSLLGTQIAPEDVSGVPRIVGERSVFCPPRVLLPEQAGPFCLFLDELPACAPDVQKAFYALLLERRLGEFALPAGTWVVAAGNRAADRALVRSLSSALVNRVIILQVRVDFGEWLSWAEGNGVRSEIRAFLSLMPEALMRPVPAEPVPFSTPRSWASLARALNLAESAGVLTPELRRALAFGRVTDTDAAAFCAFAEKGPPRDDALEVDAELERKLSMSLAELELSVRATNCLEAEGLTTVADLVARSPDELLEIRNFGETTLREVKNKLAEQGLSLGMRLPLPGSMNHVLHAAAEYAASPRPPSVTLSQAKSLIKALAGEQSLLLLSPPGVGKSDAVAQAAAEAGLPCRSLLGTQIAPEDVSGVPRIVGERSVFCPPRVLLPEQAGPFCLFLDELPACAPDVQKAFYALLLERRLGEFALPAGTWVVAAGNRAADRALVRSLSSALVNRVFVVHVRVDNKEWLAWARQSKVRPDVQGFIAFMPEALMRPVPAEPVPFSTPRSWAFLSRALERADAAGILDAAVRRALVFGRVSAEDAAIFCTMAEELIGELRPLEDYLRDPALLPEDDTTRWFIFCRIRNLVTRGELTHLEPEVVNGFLHAVPLEHRFALIVDLVPEWAALGAEPVLHDTLERVLKP